MVLTRTSQHRDFVEGKCVVDILQKEEVSTTTTDQCMFGLRTWGTDGKPAIAKKKTRLMSNANEILTAIDRTCDDSRAHQPLLDGRAGLAAIYPPALCQAMCKGLVKQLHMKKGNVKSLLKLQIGDKVGPVPEQEGNIADMEKHGVT